MGVIYKNQCLLFPEISRSYQSVGHVCSTTRYILNMASVPHLQYYPLLSSQLGPVLFPTPTPGHLAMYGDIFGYTWGREVGNDTDI